MPYKTRYRAGGKPPGDFPTLEQATDHTGYPLGQWQIVPGCPGEIRTPEDREPDVLASGEFWPARYWHINSTLVAYELIDALDADEVVTRYWGEREQAIRASAWKCLPSAGRTGSVAAARLAASCHAAGDLTLTRIATVIADTYTLDGTGLDDGTLGQAIHDVAEALRGIGVTVHPLTPAPVMAASSGVTGKLYRIWHADPEWDEPGWGEKAGETTSLTAAMAAAGHPAHSDWATRPGSPDHLFYLAAPDFAGTGYMPEWTVTGHGVARDFADSCPPEIRSDRRWSDHDTTIIGAVLAETRAARGSWKLPYPDAIDAATALRARYGTGRNDDHYDGALTTVDVYDVLAAAYTAAPCPAGPSGPAEVESIAIGLVWHLLNAGVTVTGAEALRTAERTGADTPLPWPDTTAADRAGMPIAVAARVWAWWDRLCRPVWTVTVPAGRTPRWLCFIIDQLGGLVRVLGVLWATWRLAAGPLGLRTVPGCYYFYPYQVHAMTPCPLWTDFWSLHQWAAASAYTSAFTVLLVIAFLAGLITDKLIRVELHPSAGRGEA